MMEHTCGVCARSFPTKQGLANHLRGSSPCAGSSGGDVQMDDDVQHAVTCTKCGRTFPTQLGLRSHSWQMCSRRVESCDNGADVRNTLEPRTPGAPLAHSTARDSDDLGFCSSPLSPHLRNDEDNMEGYYPPPEDPDDEADCPDPYTSAEDLEVYVNALSAAGTYDPGFVSRHLERPACAPMTEGELESIRFLRATETGNGCSRRQVQALLAYARSLGGHCTHCTRAASLPTSYYNLWSGVEEVTTSACNPLTLLCIYIPLHYIYPHIYEGTHDILHSNLLY